MHTLTKSDSLPATGVGTTLGSHRDRVSAAFGPDVRRVELRARPDGRSVEIIEHNGRRDVIFHNLSRVDPRGVRPPVYRDVVRLDLQDATSVDFSTGRVFSRGTVTLWMRSPISAAVDQPSAVAA